jgi:hypothetical protein
VGGYKTHFKWVKGVRGKVTHYKITIKAVYDETTVPKDMNVQLKDNVLRCVENGKLLNDINLEAIVEEWKVTVEEI